MADIWQALAQHVVNAVPAAALYAALAAAYALPFGIHRRADFSFGALHAFAGQMFALAAHLGWTLLWLNFASMLAFAALCALAATLAAARATSHFVLEPLAKAAPNTMLAASLAVMIVLMETARIASATRSHWIAPFLNQPLSLPMGFGADATLTLIQIINAALMAMLAFAAHLAMRGRFGRAWKAVRDDPSAAALCGIDPRAVLIRAHLGGALIAASAGILSTAWLGTMDFNASLVYGLKLVFIAALGGAMSPGAAALGGVALAGAEAAWAAFAPLVWRDIFIFALLVFVLALRRDVQESA